MMWVVSSTTYYTDVFQSGSSFSGRRRSRSPSPVGIGVRSRSMDGRMPKITVDRWESSQMLALKYKSNFAVSIIHTWHACSILKNLPKLGKDKGKRACPTWLQVNICATSKTLLLFLTQKNPHIWLDLHNIEPQVTRV